MPRKITRDYQLTNSAKHEIESQNLFPSNKQIMAYFEKNEVAGRGDGSATDIKKGVPVSRDVAEAFVEFVRLNPDDVPTEIERSISNTDDSLGDIFEWIEAYVPPTMPAPPNDPSVNGVGFVARSAAKALYNLAWRKRRSDYPNTIVNPTRDELLEYTRHARTFVGYIQSKSRKAMTPQSAYDAAMEFLKEPEDLWIDFGMRVLKVNPHCFRYATTKNGDRIGSSIAFPISDAAYDRTMRGERGFFEYEGEEIVSSSNNIVLQQYIEIPNQRFQFPGILSRLSIQASVLTQIAMMLDPVNRRPVRFISYLFMKANDRRLEGLGFRSIKDGFGKDRCFKFKYNQHPIKVVEYDPLTRRTDETRSEGFVMMMMDDILWRLRDSFDQIA